jgi:phospholipase/carboxylesterase
MLIETGAGADSDSPLIVLLHGFMGVPEDLAPFARSLGVRARFAFPEGIVDLAPRGLRGRAWWPVDVDTRSTGSPRDLSGFVPDGLEEARAHFDRLLDEMSPRGSLIVGGFSQGAMLACDATLRSDRRVDGLVMFSGARIAAEQWRPHYTRRPGRPRTFISHGRSDSDLSFAAADAFQQDLAAAGWPVTWAPFDGGHEIPVLVWRQFKRWVTA